MLVAGWLGGDWSTQGSLTTLYILQLLPAGPALYPVQACAEHLKYLSYTTKYFMQFYLILISKLLLLSGGCLYTRAALCAAPLEGPGGGCSTAGHETQLSALQTDGRPDNYQHYTCEGGMTILHCAAIIT